LPKILGMGAALPSTRVTNEELAEKLARSAAEIATRSAVEVRYYADAGQGPSDLARSAATDALREAGLDAGDVEFLIFATMTPDVTFPGSGCYLQDKLGCNTVGALDLRAQCCGFLFALDVADQFLRSGAYRNVLVAAADVHSTGLDFSPRGAEVTPLYGDGAVAVILGDGEGILETVIHSDAERFDRFWCEFPSSRRLPVRFVPEDLERANHFPQIDAEYVRLAGRKQIPEAVSEVLGRRKLDASAVKRFFFHHVYRDVAERAARDLGVGDRASVDGRDGGHIASASLPLALVRARARGEVSTGDLICLATAGSGANWAASLIRL
jgi:3-oxoacyl-[acyl-carrier-protein] synthase-3